METLDRLKHSISQRQSKRKRKRVSLKHLTIYLSMPLGTKLGVNMCGEYSGRKENT